MQDEKSSSGKGQRQHHHHKDITRFSQGWEYEAGTINVRKITGLDGEPKLQMRLDFGVCSNGDDRPPDGERAWVRIVLEYYEKRPPPAPAQAWVRVGVSSAGNQCQSLREEALMYYHRYLSLFVLGNSWRGGGTPPGICACLDIAAKCSEKRQDRLILEQYRPFIRHDECAGPGIDPSFERKNYKRAYQIVKRVCANIRLFFARFGSKGSV